MKEFTFIVLSYNQENYIVEHLESIKYLVEKFAVDMDIDLVIADDQSKDATVSVAKQWLEKNEYLFRQVCVIEREENVGTIQNIRDAISRVQTKEFKFLAGDDKYYTNNIFELYEYQDMMISPVIPCGTNPVVCKNLMDNYKLLWKHRENRKFKKMLEYEDLIPAPGVFLNGDFYRNENLWEFLSQFRLIEDYPTWYFLCMHNNHDISVQILTKPYVCYRIDSGITTQKVRNTFVENEMKRVLDVVKCKTVRYPKYINPYKYIHYFRKKMVAFDKSAEMKELERVYMSNR